MKEAAQELGPELAVEAVEEIGADVAGDRIGNAVEACDGFGVHVAMWEADRAGDMARDVCIAGAGVSVGNSGGRSTAEMG